MLSIIPAIDIIDGKCVRLIKGDYSQKKIYNENPVEVARSFEDHGMTRLHLVDLDGAKEKHVVNWRVLEAIAAKTRLTIDFGGGVKTTGDLQIVFSSGAGMVTVGSIAVKDPALFYSWLAQYGAEKLILGADVKDRRIAVSGWEEVTAIEITDFLTDYLNRGLKYVLCTDIGRDGMLTGTAVDLYKELLNHFPAMALIASGGISGIDELHELQAMGVSGAIIGKAIYEGRISLDELERFVLNA